MPPPPLIHIENISHRFEDGTFGVTEVSLSVSRGEMIVIAGPNGSGKTTLMRHFNGLLKPESGTVALDGENVFDNLVRTRRRVGMVFQDADAQIVRDTVYDEVAFGPENLGFTGGQLHAMVTGSLDRTGLSDFKDKHPFTLSGGEKRKLAIASTLVMAPDIILFDEPFSNLDYPGACGLIQCLLQLRREGVALVIATHDIETVIFHATRLIIMDRGRIRADDKPDRLAGRLEAFGVREPCSSRMGMGFRPWTR